MSDNPFDSFLTAPEAVDATPVEVKPLPDTATVKVLSDGWNADTGQYEVSACAWAEMHTDGGQCPYDLGQRGYAPRMLAIVDPDTGQPALDDSGKAFVMSSDPRSEAHVPAVRVPESLANLKRHALRLLAADSATVVASARAAAQEKA